MVQSIRKFSIPIDFLELSIQIHKIHWMHYAMQTIEITQITEPRFMAVPPFHGLWHCLAHLMRNVAQSIAS